MNEYGWRHGMRLYDFYIDGECIAEGFVHVSEDGFVWLCQNEKNGNACGGDKGGFAYSWNILRGSPADCNHNGVVYEKARNAVNCMNE
jgi:hypothetical protein